MSTKNKALPYIDVQSTSTAQSPQVRKVRFNPYTGGIISTGSDRPSFGKYTMQLRSGTRYDSRDITFRKTKKADGTWTTLTTQVPLPEVKLLIRNPNYEIVDSIIYLALSEDALIGVDNGGNFDQNQRQLSGEYYIGFSPEKSIPIIKNTSTLTIYDEIETLLKKHTIYQILELATGKSYEEVTDDGQLVTILQKNLQNLSIYAEAGFNNDSDSTLDGYFIRAKIVTSFKFDKAYLDNPKLKGMRVTTDTDSINVAVICSALRTITFKVYASTDNNFNYATETPIKTYTLDVNKKVNPTLTIPITELPAPNYNKDTEFKTSAALNEVVNSRKYIAVKIVSVVVSTGIEKVESEFTDFFEITPSTDTTKVVEFTNNIPAPTLVTFISSPTKPPYFLNLIGNLRTFYLNISQDGSGGFDASTPAGIRGFLIRYINDAGTASNTQRFYPLSKASLIRPGSIKSGTTTVEYYYTLEDFFKLTTSTENTFKLDVAYAKRIEIFLVNKYYYATRVPLTLGNEKEDITRYNMTNYFTQPGNAAFVFDKYNRLNLQAGFLVNQPRIQLTFNISYTRVLKATESAPAVNAAWTTMPDVYKLSILHGYENMVTITAIAAYISRFKTDVNIPYIDLNSVFSNVSRGQGFWFRFNLVANYRSTGSLPYTETRLGYIKQLA